MGWFASALFWHLVESSLLCGLFFVAVWALRIGDSNIRCWVYRLCLLKFAIPTVWLFGAVAEVLFAGEQGELVVLGPLRDVARSVGTLSFGIAPPAWFGSIGEVSLFPIVSVIWILGFALLVGHRVISGIRFHCFRTRGEWAFSGRERRILEHCSREAGGIEGYIVSAGPAIGLYGIFRPRIIARRAFLESLNDEELTTALQHEVAHRIRGDNLWCIAIEFVFCLFWFHPMIWSLRKRMLFEMEKACDERVLSGRENSSGYANCLLKAAAFSNQGEVVGALALSESFLKRRVRNIIEYKNTELSKMKLFTVNIVGGLLLLASFAFSAFADVNISRGLEDAEYRDTPADAVAMAKQSAREMDIRLEALEGNETALGETVFRLGELDERPKAVYQIAPGYPMKLKRKGISGWVTLTWVITDEGGVRDLGVVDASRSEFKRPAIDSIGKSKWKPGRIDGEAVHTRVSQRLDFKP